MLSKIIKNIALILEDEQTLNNLSELDKNPSANIGVGVQTYITLVNFVLSNVAENYLCYSCTQDLVSDKTGRLALADFRYTPCVIKHVKDENFKNVKYNISMDYIHVENPSSVYFVEYSFIPSDLTLLTDSVWLPIGLDYKALCYGVVSEFYALKMQFTEANIWETKFKQSLRNLNRSYREVRLANRRWN